MWLFEFRALTAINYTLLRYIPGKGYVIAASQGPWCQCNGYRSLPWDYLQCFLWMKQASPRPSNSSKLSLREGIQVSPSVSLCFVPSHLCQKRWVQGLCLNFLSIPVQVVAVDIPTHWRGRYYLPLSTNIILFAIPRAGPNSSPVRSELRKAGRDI